LDFEKYKHRFLEYLRLKSIDSHPGLIRCFSPDHEDKNPSCQISEDGFYCHSLGVCGINGDIYDAIGILEGITERKDQYLFAEKLFDGGPGAVSFRPSPEKKKAETEEEESYIRDTAAESLLEAYLNRNPEKDRMILQFLKTRATASSFGAVRDYPADITLELVKHFFYWPGYDIARQEINPDIIRRCGIPLTNPNTGKSSWDHSGVIIKLGTGYKLHFYLEGICEKRGTKKCHTFPMPGTIDLEAPVILVEGEMDALSTSAMGIKNVFSTGGTKGLTKPKIKKYLMDVKEVIIFFDADEPGRKSSGLAPIIKGDKIQNIPEKLLQAGYKGKIKVATLPHDEGGSGKDQDGLVVAGKRDVIIKALEGAKEYTPPKPPLKNNTGSLWEAFDTISIKRLKSLISKIKRDDLDNTDVKPFISACIKSCRHSETKQELAKWVASTDELDIQDNTSPYFLIEACEKYGVSKYLKNEIEKALIPASEILKRIKGQQTIVDIDFEKMEKNENALQFLTTKGVHSAALMIADILDTRMIYVESEKRHYFFNGHTWQREPDMPDVVYNILCSVMRHFLGKGIGNKGALFEIITKIEGRRFRVEASQDFSGLPHVFCESVLFDGPTVRETLTLADGVMDFSGSEIIFRKSKQEEYRREILPYKIADVKTAGTPEKFLEFMTGNFKDEKTLETLLYYISLIASRNTQYKYGGIWVGKPHTGKTTTVELLSRVYEGMFVRINGDILVTKERRRASGNEATPYIARLEGKGLGIAQETERNGILNNALWKELTGGDTLTARGLYQMPHDFVPTAQILVCTNHQPRFDAHDDAAIDRMVVIPFSMQHEKGKKGTLQQTTIYSRLRPEYPAIVKYFAEYYIRFKNEFEGAIPLSVECSNYKQNYVKEMETDLDKFVNDNLEIDMSGDAFEKVQDVYDRYLQYYDLKTEDKEALTRNKFVRYIKHDWMEINYKQKKINGEPVLCFFNIRLKTWSGKTEEPAPKETTNPVANNNPGLSYSKEPPEDEIPF
jgi:phage/plasmid-associated DNA primase